MSAVGLVTLPANATNWAGGAITIPFLQYEDTYNAIEIFRIQFDTVGVLSAAAQAFLSSTNQNGIAYSVYSQTTAITDKRTIIYHGFNVTDDSAMLDLTDDVGHGVLYPGNTIYFNAGNASGSATPTVFCRVYYRLRKVSAADLVAMINQFSIN